MCSIFFAYKAHPKYELILAANRDEFYARPTAPAGFWADAPGIFAGRDLVYGGTWLGVTRGGRFSAVTNYRDPSAPTGNLSRGNLVGDFLRESVSTENYLREIQRNAANYSGFNLLAGEFGGKLGYFSNRDANGARTLNDGVYGLSNHLLNTPWPKVSRGRKRLTELIENERFNVESLFTILRDADLADAGDLPDTGIGAELERVLSPSFIETPVYGTRCSTILLIENNGATTFAERTFQGGAKDWNETRADFQIQSPSLV